MTADRSTRITVIVGALEGAEGPRALLAEALTLAGHRLGDRELLACASYAGELRLRRPKAETTIAAAEVLAAERRAGPGDAAQARCRALNRVSRRLAEAELSLNPAPDALRRRQASIRRRLWRALKTLDIPDMSVAGAVA